MKPAAEGPIRTEIVLIGGGHAHAHVIKAFGMWPEPGVAVTLVTNTLETPYSGMIPGLIAGHYTHGECHLDLQRLARASGVRLIHAAATGIDPDGKQVLFAERPALSFDLLSIDVGITPAVAEIAGAAEHAVALKPIATLMARIAALDAQGGLRRLVTVGAGAAGVEVTLALRERFKARGGPLPDFEIVAGGKLLPHLPERVRRAFHRVLDERSVAVTTGRAARIGPAGVILEGGELCPADAVILATAAAAPAWLSQTGLALDPKGFLAVRPTLQSLWHPDVFAVGDCATMVETPRAKAGVFAVRQGPPLEQNLRRRARRQPLIPYRPQERYLALISTGDRHAIGVRGNLSVEGDWVWRWKDAIDRRWMAMYQDLPAIAPVIDPADEDPRMRCGGCAAKVGPGALARALGMLGPAAHEDGVIVGLASPDDAAVTLPPPGRLVHSIDQFRAFIDDPHVFADIATNHALSDLFAMGARPLHALAIATVPHGPEARVAETLATLLSAARARLEAEGAVLIGGHSSEGAELQFGLSVTGVIDPGAPITTKAGVKAGDALILTKPIGTGIVFAADMRVAALAGEVEAAIAAMRVSNRAAARLFAEAGVTAATDVTGYGLGGHLIEMAKASDIGLRLDLAAVPLLPGASRLAEAGYASSLLPANAVMELQLGGRALTAPERALLFDPQTSGGLLGAIAADKAGALVSALRRAGYTQAEIIGTAESGGTPGRIEIAPTLNRPG